MTTIELDRVERSIINAYQRDFPLTSRPFARIAKSLDVSEERVIEVLKGLEKKRVLSRIGAVIAPNKAGASTLAAISVPSDRLNEVADIVNDHPEVNHNYEREHNLNLWFVATASDAGRLAELLSEISAETGLDVIDLPLIEAYHIDLGFPV